MDKPIKTYTYAQLVELMACLKQPKFRAKQLFEWLYKRGVSSYDEMTNLPATLREELRQSNPLHTPKVLEHATSKDCTHKFLLQLHDGATVETVLIPSSSGGKATVCISTQAGCPMACEFCATGKEGLTRSLSLGEIVDQVLVAKGATDVSVSNVVAMGQGEPFLNYSSTIEALRVINSKDALNIGARRICVSTCGVIEGIQKLSCEPEQFTLAVSLHSAIQETRDKMMPKVANQTLGELRQALVEYVVKTNRRITFEYIMAAGLNDTQEHLNALISYCKGFLCHVNFIQLNSVPGSQFKPSSLNVVKQWCNALNESGTEATIRRSHGSDIAGACGQLKNTYSNKH